MAKGSLFLARDGSEHLPYVLFKMKPRWIGRNKSWVPMRNNLSIYQPLVYMTANDAEQAFDTVLAEGKCQRVSFELPDLIKEVVN